MWSTIRLWKRWSWLLVLHLNESYFSFLSVFLKIVTPLRPRTATNFQAVDLSIKWHILSTNEALDWALAILK